MTEDSGGKKPTHVKFDQQQRNFSSLLYDLLVRSKFLIMPCYRPHHDHPFGLQDGLK